jgi:hypothetical protein
MEGGDRGAVTQFSNGTTQGTFQPNLSLIWCRGFRGEDILQVSSFVNHVCIDTFKEGFAFTLTFKKIYQYVTIWF